MTKIKRYSPLIILFDLGKLLRNSSFFAIYLYVVNTNSESFFIKYGRIVFLIAVGLTLFSIVYKWFTHKYELDDQSFHLYKGLFSKSEQTIPFSKIQNVNRHTSLFHRIFKMTSIHFETAMTGENATIKFKVISQIDAELMEEHIKNMVLADSVDLNHEFADPRLEVEHQSPNRTIHFQPTKKDILKASFTSLSFLVFIPLIGSFYYKINEFFHVEDTVEGFFEKIISSWWFVTIIVIVLVIASAIFGIAKTFFKYGKYEISSDSNHIYITRGVIDETALSISKEKVQAIEIDQSLIKRLLGLAEVKLTSAGGLSSGEDTYEINTLYPFLPVNKAYQMVSDILPSYVITQEMNRLPKKSFWVRILRPSWIWIIATGALFYFKPTILDVEQAWIILSALLLLCVLIARLLNFSHTRYVINDHFIQFKKGILTTSLFVSKREKVIEVKVTRNIVQKMLGLASIETTNRGKPVHHAGVDDVPTELANSFLLWYVGRKNEIKVE
ncbi:PH domain-containing protein [Hazenella coriacea]|uniref:Putative membrane protein n=1 Tax=Hazenella coriacea TaxID=1179467 RepID=A0A4R3L569_9BACL|nr:PH domain-containing protein [Hazenella coriacea]TCS94148.1 putative membrane protein [Hazenella coriacea]